MKQDCSSKMTVTNPNSSGEISLIAHTTHLSQQLQDRWRTTTYREHCYCQQLTLVITAQDSTDRPLTKLRPIRELTQQHPVPPRPLGQQFHMSCGPTHKSCHSNEVGAEDALLSSITRWALSLMASQQDCTASLTATSVLSTHLPHPGTEAGATPQAPAVGHWSLFTPTKDLLPWEQQRRVT